MKIIDAIKNVDKSKPHDWIDGEELAKALDINTYDYPEDFMKRVQCYWLFNWLCTDTWVGGQVYYMDNEPVAVTFQTGRKSDLRVYFVSNEAAEKVRAYLLTAVKTPYDVISMDYDLPDTHSVSFNSQLLTKTGLYQGVPVEIVKLHTGADYGLNTTIDVRTADGTVTTIEVTELDIPLNMAPVLSSV